MQTGVHCTLKHFPGLGRVYEDTHRVTAELAVPSRELEQSDWLPFRQVMAQGAAFTMLSHARLTAIDRDRPASFSAAVVKGLLRESWKHDGILVTDDFSMGAVTLSHEGAAGGAIAALNAGVDLLLVSYDPDQYFPMMYALLAAARDGRLRTDMLEASTARLRRAASPCGFESAVRACADAAASATIVNKVLKSLLLRGAPATHRWAWLAGSRSREVDVLRLLRAVIAVAVLLGIAPGANDAARAVEAINVRVDASAIDLTEAVERLKSESDRIQVSTAPGADGIVRRIEVRAREAGQNWAVFALANNSDEQIDRLIVAPHYRMVDSGLWWPDLGLSRIVNITPSSGDRPDRQDSPSADIFRITLDPGTVITYVVELRSDRLPQLYLWEPDAYKDKINSFTLYHGIVIGIAGLLALFLTILFVVKGSVMFPAAAALGWAVLVYIGTDFGFWGKVFDLSAGTERVWRASGEAILAATLVVFLFAYLNLNRWHVRYAHITAGWLVFLGALTAVAVFNPAVASGVARLSLAIVAVAGLGLVVYLATHGFDRAVLLIPTWLLLVVWVFAASLAVNGIVTNDIVGARAARRPGADRDADRLHGDAARVRGRRRHCDRVRHRKTGSRPDGLRRHDLGLGRPERSRVHLARNRNPARPQARHARRLGGGLARAAASARPRPLPRLARRRARSAPRPPVPRVSPAHHRRPLHVVRPEGAPGRRLRRRSGAPCRHAHRRDRVQDRGRAPAARCRARQSHRPAEPRAVSSTGSMPRFRSPRPTPPSARP